MKMISDDLSFSQIVFMRYLSAAIVMIPVIFYYGRENFMVTYLGVNLLRGFMLFMGFSTWVYGLTIITVPTATVINFTIPFFVVLFSFLFLRERITASLILSIVVGLIGAIITLDPSAIDFNPYSILILAAPAVFAGTDIINKFYVDKDPMITSLFYTSLAICLFAAVPAFMSWKPLTLYTFATVFLLGVIANLLFWFLLQSYSMMKVSFFAPHRYMELVFSGILSYLLLGENVSTQTLLGAAIIIPAALFSSRYHH